MKFRSPLQNARGLGSAKDGTNHWWMQRVTAVALVPLMVWLSYGIARSSGADYEQARAWLASPLAAVLMLATIWALFLHAKLGLQVVVEDYVSHEGRKVIVLMLINFTLILLSLAAAVSVLRIALAG